VGAVGVARKNAPDARCTAGMSWRGAAVEVTASVSGSEALAVSVASGRGRRRRCGGVGCRRLPLGEAANYRGGDDERCLFQSL
jgi:hypothetical protein